MAATGCVHHSHYSAAQSCPTLSNHVDCSIPGFPVLHHLPDPAQTHVHCLYVSLSIPMYLCDPKWFLHFSVVEKYWKRNVVFHDAWKVFAIQMSLSMHSFLSTEHNHGLFISMSSMSVLVLWQVELSGGNRDHRAGEEDSIYSLAFYGKRRKSKELCWAL